ncbi:MAG: hypothetical protein COW01_05220 [Bdellovibrionales bacterium CG12_big_fil_rev_8_21_14_0_65_38_15]|nr:MAG: hypothetical protein COW79_00710 [Bdellovibrionales bacterium CG22_combo_CG10-13_8_21_14_all_38_13]PIQ56151.1 MAG: hypothetical protein COW01_05220 [Bdellovibrionales bacterium CG12_big_fil_rev_8_21_14_0_65_38_15]PIR29775.1 MAG: hypothetical protein COV38_08665 [Bdellovibrionales bacterium CG11_big_fil_rev_8_21_14_0_20_38_13]
MGIKIIRSTPLKSLLVALILMSQSQAFALTDQEAADLGMTPVESLEKIQKGQSFDPSIDNLITKAGVVVVVDKSIRTSHRPSGQTATVYVDGHYYSEYDISSGTEELKETTSGRKYVATTPVGIYRPIRAYKDYMSRTFLSAPMTWAVFFNGGIATHATTRGAYAKLGHRASGGCIRMKLEEAEEVNQLIVSRGEANMNTVDQSEVIDGAMLKRVLYINRDKFPTVDRMTGKFLQEQMWTYDSLVVVIGG